MIRSALLAALPGVRHAHTTRADGPVGGRGVEGAGAVRVALAAEVSCRPDALVVPAQVHGTNVALVGEENGEEDVGRTIPATDGLVTRAPGIALFVQGADCPLLALADDEAGVVAVAHSGWRGTAARIAGECVRVAAAAGARPERLRAAVFPGIGPCCFEVGPEVLAAFRETFGAAAAGWTLPAARPDGARLDLRAAIAETLVAAGVRRDAIDVVPGCTACDGRFFSHRASRGGPERHGLAAALAPAGLSGLAATSSGTAATRA